MSYGQILHDTFADWASDDAHTRLCGYIENEFTGRQLEMVAVAMGRIRRSEAVDRLARAEAEIRTEEQFD